MGDSISIAPPRAMAAVTAFGHVARVRETLQAHFVASLPETAGWVEARDTRLSCLAPHRFLVQGARGTRPAATLAPLLDEIAAVTDQSDLWHTVALSGPSAADRLARIVPIDLDPSVFPPGSLALTRGLHIDIRLWRLDMTDWELAVSRSYASYLAHALHA